MVKMRLEPVASVVGLSASRSHAPTAQSSFRLKVYQPLIIQHLSNPSHNLLFMLRHRGPKQGLALGDVSTEGMWPQGEGGCRQSLLVDVSGSSKPRENRTLSEALSFHSQ